METGEGGQDLSTDGPDAPADLAAWLIDGAEQLHRALAETDPERRCWTFGFPPSEPGSGVAGRPSRPPSTGGTRRHAVGDVIPIAPQLASAGIDEVVDFLYPCQVALGRTAELAAQRQACLDRPRRDLVAGPAGTEPRVQVAGPAASLVLLLWRRITFDDPSLTIVWR